MGLGDSRQEVLVPSAVNTRSTLPAQGPVAGRAVHFASQDEVYMRTNSSAWSSDAGRSIWNSAQSGSIPPLPTVPDERLRPMEVRSSRSMSLPIDPVSHREAPETTIGSEVARAPADMASTLRLRSLWQVGSMLEVFSTSLGCWHVALVTQVTQGQLLTVRFADAKGELLSKMLARSDMQLAALGSNLNDLPPGFKTVPSQSRPGQVAFLDAAKGIKYQNFELAWRAYIERLIDPAVDPRKYADPGPGSTAPETPAASVFPSVLSSALASITAQPSQSFAAGQQSQFLTAAPPSQTLDGPFRSARTTSVLHSVRGAEPNEVASGRRTRHDVCA